MLTSAQLAQMQTDALDALPETATLTRPTYAADGAGGQTPTYASAGTAACRVDPILGYQSQLVAERVGNPALVVIWFPATLSIYANDRAVVNGVTYEIVQVQVTSYAVLKKSWAIPVT